jgi:transcriptional regulator with XRE-family HTH domain
MAAQLLCVRRNSKSLLMPPTSDRALAPGFLPDSAADTTMDSRQSFCLALKAARERRGVTLAQIAQATKVCVSHFAALERNDLRSWPKGLFRRAFFRGYVEMIGLPVAETMDEFAGLFPDNDTAALVARPAADASALRLSLDASWHGPRVPIAWRIVTAMIDGVAVLVLAAALKWLAGTHGGTTVAIISVSYFTLATVLLGDSPTASLMRWLRTPAAPQPEAALDEPVGVVAQAWRRGVNVAATLLRSDGEDAPREAPPRLRVRFKLP